MKEIGPVPYTVLKHKNDVTVSNMDLFVLLYIMFRIQLFNKQISDKYVIEKI